ncbi:hypothetical protein HML84_17360 [Alcanivorax sp. IO_7]|nr:hypothetical protein HML84_17360 [Alcanivorax sp. IO_7]
MALSLTLDPRMLAELLADLPDPAGQAGPERAFSVAATTRNCWAPGCACCV